MFINMEVLLNLSQQFLMVLESRVASMTNFTCIGDIFLRFEGVFPLYSKYYRKYDSAVQRLETLSQNEEFKTRLTVRLRALTFPLPSLTLLPLYNK